MSARLRDPPLSAETSGSRPITHSAARNRARARASSVPTQRLAQGKCQLRSGDEEFQHVGIRGSGSSEEAAVPLEVVEDDLEQLVPEPALHAAGVLAGVQHEVVGGRLDGQLDGVGPGFSEMLLP